MKENQIRHSENLHGKPGVEGLTGFYKGAFYDRGFHRLPKERQPMQNTDNLGKPTVIFERRVIGGR